MASILDTHTFLWFIAGDKQLPNKIKSIILNFEEQCYISVASFWEIAIKLQIGKLETKMTLESMFQYAEQNQFVVLPISEKHLIRLLDLEFVHNHPFDRLIIAQTLSENFTVLSRDKIFKKYKVKQLWD
jgi:PIN domain nuclease of toxin-antitoxin system